MSNKNTKKIGADDVVRTKGGIQTSIRAGTDPKTTTKPSLTGHFKVEVKGISLP